MPRITARRALLCLSSTCALAALTPAGAAADVVFGPAPATGLPSENDLIAADFDGDGVLDLAGNNFGRRDVSVALGNGNGTFAASSSSPLGITPGTMASGDLDEDGNDDVVVGSYTATALSLLMSDGDGTFTAASAVPDNEPPGAITIGDVDGDGHLDLVTAPSLGSQKVLVSLGDGTGGFDTAIESATIGGATIALDLADFDDDGDLDLLARANDGIGTLRVALGNGDGTFAEPTSYQPGVRVLDAVVRDFDGDGIPDVAAADTDSDTVLVLRSNGDGTFGPPATTSSLGDGPDWLDAADFDRDGDQDLVVVNSLDGSMAVLDNPGDGAFASGQIPASPMMPGTPVAGDFDGDGAADLALLEGVSRTPALWLNTPTADPSPASLTFGSQSAPVPQGTLSPSQTTAIVNNGAVPLSIGGFVFGGANPDDFVIGTDTCRRPVAPGASCTISVRFAPQAQGERSGTLMVLSDAREGDTAIALTGTAGPQPQGPQGDQGQEGDQGPQGVAGQDGARGDTGAPGAAGATGERGADGTGAAGATGPQGPAGPDGPAGPQGPAGSAGQIRLVTCTTGKPARGRRTTRRCTTRTIAGNATFTTAPTARASLARNGRVYATGSASRTRGLRLHATRTVPSGRYRLTLHYRDGRRHVTTRATIRIR
ncbi:FG-GAP-like repeat-containing protein [Conexibacter stalactiti]|uniref:FG-GAP-like repeat-containing protein n=1 Tax=Conexibacter stalactiti TaxID=1940611 RepID=A0ABU4HQX8_9ACTN|nr:FG-GAP-like repeat-containing protein [Conexibacter stalactiti]MDW5595117.1 FG-GAP-like repeat-containing protein [Conexibacter stalactiti]MEC5035759.1 FG-GAP-like repeat-containing protein [Conexibacter stalactiti]